MAYGNHAEIGQAIKESIAAGTVKRDELFITSKIWNTWHSQAKCAEAVDLVLSELQLDYIDMMLIHWPQGYAEIPLPPGQILPKAISLHVFRKENKKHILQDENGVLMYADTDYVDTWKALQVDCFQLCSYSKSSCRTRCAGVKCARLVCRTSTTSSYNGCWTRVVMCR